MKLNLNSKDFDNIDQIGDNHIGTSSETPIREDAFRLNSDEKIEIIIDDVRHIMETLGLDLSDDSLSGTPKRVAKMFVNEIFSGLDPKNKPKASTFQNKYNHAILQLLLGVLMTFLLQVLCLRKMDIISWIIVFIPFIFYTYMIMIIYYVFGINPDVESEDKDDADEDSETNEKDE